MPLSKFVLVIFSAIIFFSCRTSQNLNYFIDQPDSSHQSIVQNFDNVIQPADKISIIVSSLDLPAAQPYNLINPAPVNSSNQQLGYTVDPDGYIQFSQLGKIKAGGLSIQQLKTILTDSLSIYLNKPVVTIEFLNFKVTVLGEVARQGIINVPDGKITLLEALGQSGDVTIYGRKDKVQVIRTEGGKRSFGIVNLQHYDAFKSPYFKLQQNDVVVVESNNKKINADDQLFQRNIAITTSIVSVATTLALLIFNLTR